MRTRKRTTRKEFPAEPGDEGVRERILEAAEAGFHRHGLARVSMDDLAADLGMSKKTIYKYFPSRSALRASFVRRTMRRIESGVASVTDADGTPLEKVTGVLGVVGSQILRFNREMAADVARLEPALWKEVVRFRRGMLTRRILPLLRDAKEAGMMRPDLRPELFFLILLHAVEGIINPEALAEQSFSAGEAFAGIYHILFRGALTPEAAEEFRTALLAPVLDPGEALAGPPVRPRTEQ